MESVFMVVIFIMLVVLLMIAWISQVLADEITDDEVAVKTIAYEASNQPLEAQIAVGIVIRNRMIERCKTSRQVCLEPYQFSCWKNGKPTQRRKLKQKEIEEAELAWEYSANQKNFPANLYHDISCEPYWTKSRDVTFIRQIGDLKFYREVR